MNRIYPEKNPVMSDQIISWKSVFGGMAPYDIVDSFLTGRLDLYRIEEEYDASEYYYEKASKIIIESLLSVSFSDIMEMIRAIPNESFSTKQTQFIYNVDDMLISELNYLSNKDGTYYEIGAAMPGCNTKTPANTKKYASVHSIFLSNLDLVWIYRDTTHIVKISPLGKEFRKYSLAEREELFYKMLFAIPIIRNIMKMKNIDENSIKDELKKEFNDTSVNRWYPTYKYLTAELLKRI